METSDLPRGVLVESIERDEKELEEALDDLQEAAQHTFSLSDKIAHRPWPWLVGGVLLGLWLGVRGRAGD